MLRRRHDLGGQFDIVWFEEDQSDCRPVRSGKLNDIASIFDIENEPDRASAHAFAQIAIGREANCAEFWKWDGLSLSACYARSR